MGNIPGKARVSQVSSVFFGYWGALGREGISLVSNTELNRSLRNFPSCLPFEVNGKRMSAAEPSPGTTAPTAERVRGRRDADR